MTSSRSGRSTSRILMKIVSSSSSIERRTRLSWLCGNGSKVLKKIVFADCFMTKVACTSQSTSGPMKVTPSIAFEYSLNFRMKKSIVVYVEAWSGQSTLYKFLISPNSSTEKIFNMFTALFSYRRSTVRTPSYRVLMITIPITIFRDS